MKKSVIFIIAGVVIVMGVYITQYLGRPLETKVAKITEYEESVTGEAYFVRKESVYNAGGTGTVYNYAQEGTRVGKDRLISTVYNGIVDSQILQELNNLDKKIVELTEYNKNNIFVADKSDAENRLKNYKNQIVAAAAENEPSDIAKIKNSIKNITSGEDNDNVENEIAALKSQKQELENQLGHSKTDIYSDSSGVFTTNIDGLENILTVDKINEYTLADFEAVKDSFSDNSNKVSAQVGEPVSKVIDNHVWYVMIKMQKEKLQNYEKNQKVILRFDSVPGVEAEATLANISVNDKETDGIAIFECEQYIEGVFSIRQTAVDVISKQYRGFEIPIYALRVEEEQQGVMVQYGINEIFKPCNVIFTNKENGTVIVESVTKDVKNPLEQYDKIVLGEKAEKQERK